MSGPFVCLSLPKRLFSLGFVDKSVPSMGISLKSPKDGFPQVAPRVHRGSHGCCSASIEPGTLLFTTPFPTAGVQGQQAPPSLIPHMPSPLPQQF